ncbi:MAG: Asp23/Gls24 family envelope stress response protein, partial [Candidatus Atribacteria bacterium]|nr:Asp23/Gls24 family envelope stress response protein [Candidatus Atribacteria bacterium]
LMETIKTIYGKVNIPKETIENLVKINLVDVKGLVGSKKTIIKEITDILRGKIDNEDRNRRNIKVEVKKDGIFIDLFIVLKYGVRIPDIAWEIQNKIKKELKKQIEAENIEINIHVQGIQFSKKMQSKKNLMASNIFVKVF